MSRKVTVVGASLGGLVAAAALNERGCDVTIIEQGTTVSGLYGTVATPFGEQELGMHVLYLSDEHYRLAGEIFGGDALDSWTGNAVDVGACHNFGRNFFGSPYPDVRGLPTASTILGQMLASQPPAHPPVNALESVIGRFGDEAGRHVVAPILAKLWQEGAERLSAGAIHCFYDLRRLIVCDKARADELKQDPWFDAVIGNPEQYRPSGAVFGGRRAARFKHGLGDVGGRVRAWLRRAGITIAFGQPVTIVDQRFLVEGVPLDERADACIVATPVAHMAPQLAASLDQVTLSIYYVRLARPLGDSFPAYYLLCHGTSSGVARIVHYDAYHFDRPADRPTVLAVEVLHPPQAPPADEAVAQEVQAILPAAAIAAVYRLPRSLRLASPTLANACQLDGLTAGAAALFRHDSLFLTGMRTDTGVFFSHQTIGRAYDAALECARRLA